MARSPGRSPGSIRRRSCTKDLDGDDAEAARRRKAASKTKYTCPACELNAWAKPGVNLVCGDCGETMEPEE
jgi:hypothetical protein